MSIVSEVFEKVVNNTLVDDLEQNGLSSKFESVRFRVFSINLRSSDSLSDRTVWAFNKSGATPALPLDIFNTFHKLKSFGFSVQILGLI